MTKNSILADRFGATGFLFIVAASLVAVVFTLMLSPQKAFAAGDLTSVTIASNNAASTTLAHPGNIVTVSFTASSSLSVAPTATINGVAATISGSGTSWSAATTTNAATANGLMTFVISDTEFSSTYTATTNSSAVTFSNVLPIVAPITIASNNASTSLAKSGNTVTLSFTSSEAIQAPTVTIGAHSGITAITSNPTASTTWTATATINGSDSNGVLTFSIGTPTDFYGNATTSATWTTNGSAVRVNETAPTISPITIASNNGSTTLATTGNVVTLSFTSSAAIQAPTVTIGAHSGITAITSNPTASTTWTAAATISSSDTSGSSLSFTITTPTDLYGNATSSATWLTSGSNVIVDNTRPVISILGTNPASVSFKGTYSDAGATATDLLGDSITSSIVTSNSVNTSVPGTYSVTYNVSDAAGVAATAVSRSVTVGSAGGGGILSLCNSGYTYSGGFCYSSSAAPTPNSSSSTAPNSGTGTGATTYIFTRTLSIGSTGADVTALQNLLTQDGFYSGPVTGYFGSVTKAAVEAYQKANGLSQVGIVGPLTRAMLNQGNKPNTSMTATSSSPYSFATNLTVGSTGADVTALQQWLTQKGFYSGPLSGYFGNLTMTAVKAFQGANKLPQTGYVGSLSRAVLNANQ